MKILIITVHDIGNNFGSTLQSCSLYEFLYKNGYDTKIINYKPEYRNFKQKIKEILVNSFYIREYVKRKKSFDAYYLKHCHLTNRVYYKFHELRYLSNAADVYITGSDQVWNPNEPCGNDAAYYLEFTNSQKKMSYASSLGCLLNCEQIVSLQLRLKDYKFISVREKESKIQLIENGATNVSYVLDPVFLWPKEYYISNQDKISCSDYGRYLLVYAVNEDKLLSMTVKQLAVKNNLKVILIGGLKKKCECDLFMRSAGPKEFLNLINNAEIVVTSSFHAVAFSLIFNKQFYVIRPKNNSLRIDSILNISATSDRVVFKEEDIQKIGTKIDYELTNELLKPIIEDSKTFLLNALKKFEENIPDKCCKKFAKI